MILIDNNGLKLKVNVVSYADSGVHPLTLVMSDSNVQSTYNFVMTVFNTPPKFDPVPKD